MQLLAGVRAVSHSSFAPLCRAILNSGPAICGALNSQQGSLYAFCSRLHRVALNNCTDHTRRLSTSPRLDLQALIVQIRADVGVRYVGIERAQVFDKAPHSRLDRQTVWLILILLYLSYDLRDFPALAEVY
jgi:hypothetical protein